MCVCASVCVCVCVRERVIVCNCVRPRFVEILFRIYTPACNKMKVVRTLSHSFIHSFIHFFFSLVRRAFPLTWFPFEIFKSYFPEVDLLIRL